MKTPASSRPGGMRRSHKVALVLLGTAGVVGLAAIYDAWRDSTTDDDGTASAAPAPVPVSADRVYANNDYVPGIGFYHAPYHAWFPHPFNYHDPARGYFAGGLWQAAPWVLALSQSQPSSTAVTAALAAQRQAQDQQQSRGMNFTGAGARGTFGAARPGRAVPSTPKPGVIRGGFGFSAHPAGG